MNVTRGNCVWRVPMLPDGSPYKVGLLIQMSGGADNRTLYITESESGSILCADMPVPGQPMYSHA